jgi:16S rRNA (cytosine967-C5)-methyltransferase
MKGGKSEKCDSSLLARWVVFLTLSEHKKRGLPTDRIWDVAAHYSLNQMDKNFAFDLLCGTIKRRRTIDFLIEHFSGRKIQTIEPELQEILRLGGYQLLFEKTVPVYAAVDTSCELAQKVIGKRAVGFANAVLRNVDRGIEQRNCLFENSCSSKFLPVDWNEGVLFREELFSELAIQYSYPDWLIKRWEETWNLQELRGVLSFGNARPLLTVRPNRLKLGQNPAAELCEILKIQGCDVAVHLDIEAITLIKHPPIMELPAFRDGLFQVQDSTAMQIVHRIQLDRGMTVLDLCAGLGTKTTQLAEKFSNEVEITATDVQPEKLIKLKENCHRLGISCVRTIPYSDLESLDRRGTFDAILLDVPCSNTGVFDRRPEARWRLRKEDFLAYEILSINLLEKAQYLLNDNGKIYFSTCSIDFEENKNPIQKMIQSGKWKLESEWLTLPTLDNTTGKTLFTGGFGAILSQS